MFLKFDKKICATLLIFAMLIILWAAFLPVDLAFADDYMTDINFRGLVENPDSSEQGTILTGGTYILQQLVTFIFLPIAIVFVVWKVVVIGICTIIGVDYTKFLNLTSGLHKTGKVNEEKATALKDPKDSAGKVKEIMRDTVKGLIIVFCVWGIIELIMVGVYIFIEMGKNFGG